MHRRFMLLAAALAGATALACHDSGPTALAANQGEMELRLKDAPFPFDSVKAVNVFITRIDAKFAHDEASENEHEDHDDSVLVARDTGSTAFWWRWLNLGERHGGFVTVATPNTTFNLLELQNGASAFLGTTVVDTGTLKDLRVVIDPSKSSIEMKDGTTLTGAANPFGRYPPGAMIVLRVKIEDDVVVRARSRTTVMIDFDLNTSFVLMGPSIRSNGFRLESGLSARHHDG